LAILAEDLAQEKKWAADIKYHAARSIWRKRREFVPSRKYRWERWFEVKFGESLDAYAERASQAKEAGAPFG
jgi:predicted NAD/FAD-binding protein